MRALVTGVAGFVGSQVAEALLCRDDWVVGLDTVGAGGPNLEALTGRPRFEFCSTNLARGDLDIPLRGVDVVFHLAGRPGVRTSWHGLTDYVTDNIVATQRLLEAARARGTPRLVYASSSSVYGDTAPRPVDEEAPVRPSSPYGMTKLAAEHLCHMYAESFGMNVVSLRLFTVYGPRQRPDMAVHRLISSCLSGRPFPLYGDGSQERDMTFVGDVVDAFLAAGAAPRLAPGSVFNVAGGQLVSVLGLIAMVEQAVGRPVAIDHRSAEPGDVTVTHACVTRALSVLGWSPRTSLEAGLEAQVAWQDAASGAS